MGYKLPEGCFTKWLFDEIDADRIQPDFRHFDYSPFVSECITKEDIKQWNKKKPVFISAQTGSGKTKFVIDCLIDSVKKKNRKRSEKGEPTKKILIISNRLALIRQIKSEVSDAVIDITFDTRHKTDLEYNLKPGGVDKKTDFGITHVHSYQGISDAIFKENQYQYIICDECHFFTSDASFNENTYAALETIIRNGQDAIRIYMSATPEVAFEAIIRTEYSYRFPHVMEILSKIGKIKDKKKTLEFFYYDIKRDYHLINIHREYQSVQNMYDLVESEKQKWVIFVSSIDKGKKIRNHLNGYDEDDKNGKDKIDGAVLVTSENKDDGVSGEVFNKIIEKEEFPCKYLISTSVLDNGVNIKRKGIKGIIIDEIYDRVEVLQMIGRIRMREESQELDVFLIMPPLKKLYDQTFKHLLATLSYDLMESDMKHDFVSMTKYANSRVGGNFDGLFHWNSETKSHEYNICSVYDLLDRLIFLKRHYDSEIGKEGNLSDELRALRGELYEKYMERNNGATWNRNIVDLIESEKEKRIRASEKETKISKGKWKPGEDPFFYTYKRGETFYNYIYAVFIPDWYNRKIKDTILRYLDNSKLKGKYIAHLEHDYGVSCKDFMSRGYLIGAEVINFTRKFFVKHGIPLQFEVITDCFYEMRRYRALGNDNNYKNFSDEVYRWFERPVPPPEDRASEGDDDGSEITDAYFEKYILDKHYEKGKDRIIDKATGKEMPFDADYIKKHSLWKRDTNPDGSECDYSKFLKLKKLTDIKKGAEVTLDGEKYIADPQDTGDSKYRTGYFFIPAP